ncbi:hypothetical protein RhiJN_23107 [Ceratobasidium sp. AG-Ba]|nr:hypothetical protein RhiJN_23107 [Ceratobasidium sp. AG-Ba]
MSIWGPDFRRYSTMTTFESCAAGISRKEEEDFRRVHHDIPSLSSLEDELNYMDPRYIRIGGCYLPGAAAEHQSYMAYMVKVNPSHFLISNIKKIFSNYYGYLIIRRLITIICYDALQELNLVETAATYLRPEASRAEMDRFFAFPVVHAAVQVAHRPSLLVNFITKIPSMNAILQSPARLSYAAAIIDSLWGDRGSFITLYSYGLLPGAAILLLSLWTILPSDSNDQECDMCIPRPSERLTVRLYLVGSEYDRQVLQPPCIPAVSNVAGVTARNRNFAQFCGQEDSRLMLQAYSELLALVQSDGKHAMNVSASLIRRLSEFAFELLATNSSTTGRELIDVAHSVINFFWLVLEEKGSDSTTEIEEVVKHTIMIFSFLRFVF